MSIYILSEPTAPPPNVTVTNVTSFNITVQWGSVPCIHQNGNITGYSVQYGVNESENTQTVSVNGAGVIEATLSNLTASTVYSVQVAAVNDADTGVFSNSQFVMTLGRKLGFRFGSNITSILIATSYSCSSGPHSRLHNSHLHLPLLD